MRTKNELYQAALRAVSARRQMARARAEDERAAAEAAIPALRHAEEEVRVRGIRCALAGAQGGSRAAAAESLAAAKQNLAQLLAASGRSPSCLEPRFTCKACEDTGVVAGHTCQCVRRVMQQLRREEIEQLSSLKVASFDTLSLDYYPNLRDAQTGKPIRMYMAEVLDDLKAYADEFDPSSENLMLFGNAGLGKTHAALAVAGVALDKGYDVIYVSSPSFFSRLEDLRFGGDPDGERDALMETAVNADLLILDDLGTEFLSQYLLSALYTLLNTRLGAHRPTIITTNIVDGSILEKRYTEKISSRIAAFVPFHFLGQDVRAAKANEG